MGNASNVGCFVILRESNAIDEPLREQAEEAAGVVENAIHSFSLRLRHAPLIPSRYGILKKRSLWLSAAAALLIAAALAGCGKTEYFAGRVLPPSGLTRRVLIAIQNPGAFAKGALQIVDAFYDTRYAYRSEEHTSELQSP